MSGLFRLAAAVAIGVAVGILGVVFSQRWYPERERPSVPLQVEADRSGWQECGDRDGWRWRDCRFAGEASRAPPTPAAPETSPPVGYIEWSGDPSSRRVVPR